MQSSTAEIALRTQELIAITSFVRAGIVTPEIIIAGDNIAISIEKLTHIISSDENPLTEEGFNQLQAEISRMAQCVMPIAYA